MTTLSNTMAADCSNVEERLTQRTTQVHEILCCYVNRTQCTQIVRITNIPHYFFERTVLPGKQLLFAASSGAELEVHTYRIVTAMLTERIPCDRLSHGSCHLA